MVEEWPTKCNFFIVQGAWAISSGSRTLPAKLGCREYARNYAHPNQ